LNELEFLFADKVFPVERSEVEFAAHNHALLGCAVGLALTAEYAAVVIAVDFPNALIRIVFHDDGVRGADLGTSHASDAQFVIRDGFAPEFFRGDMGFKWIFGCIGR
jgi:hypothetical protein